MPSQFYKQTNSCHQTFLSQKKALLKLVKRGPKVTLVLRINHGCSDCLSDFSPDIDNVDTAPRTQTFTQKKSFETKDFWGQFPFFLCEERRGEVTLTYPYYC